MKENIVLIIRGIPGSGKSALAKALYFSATKGTAAYCEADKYFYNSDGEYNYDPSKLDEAHTECFKEFKLALACGSSLVIVSNTSTRFREFKRYIDAAEIAGYKVHIVVKENYHDGTSAHDVPSRTIENMRNRFTVSL